MRFVGSVCSSKMLVNFCQTIRSLVIFFVNVRKCMCVQKKGHGVKTCSVLTPVQPFRNSFTVQECKILKFLICIEM